MGGTKLGPQHLAFGDLAQPDRIQHIGLGSAGQVFDVAGVDRPRLQAVRFEQVEHRPPVIAGRLHHHTLHTEFDQMVGQLGQRPGHRRMGGHLLSSPLGTRAGDPDTTQHLRLADVQGSDPGDDLLLIIGFTQHDVLLTSGNRPLTRVAAQWGSQGRQ